MYASEGILSPLQGSLPMCARSPCARLARSHSLAPLRGVVSFLFFGLILGIPALPAQHTYTAGDIENGGRLYASMCVNCHGADGKLAPGADLATGKFKSGTSDEQLIRAIRNGISGTAMPPQDLTEFEAGSVVAYLRSLALMGSRASSGGDAARGQAIFEGKGGCLGCHRIGGNGSRVGPDLSDIGALRSPVELERSIVDPGSTIRPQNRFFRVVTRAGSTITGRLLNLDTFSVQLIDSDERLRSFVKSDLREYAFVQQSPMPRFRDKLTAAELADLVAYLSSLKGIEK